MLATAAFACRNASDRNASKDQPSAAKTVEQPDRTTDQPAANDTWKNAGQDQQPGKQDTEQGSEDQPSSENQQQGQEQAPGMQGTEGTPQSTTPNAPNPDTTVPMSQDAGVAPLPPTARDPDLKAQPEAQPETQPDSDTDTNANQKPSDQNPPMER
jgi:hypothetical protein